MSSKKLDDYKAKFLEGTLSSQEEPEFEKLLSEDRNTENTLFRNYWALARHPESGDFSPVLKEQFFTSVDRDAKRKQKWLYRASAATAACMVVALGSYWGVRSSEHTQTSTITRAEIDRSFETTRLALNSFSTRLSKGMKSIDKGINFSMPFGSLSKIKTGGTNMNNDHHINE